MRRIYIVGGNGFARECYLNFLKMCSKDSELQFGGFLGHGGYGHTVDYQHLQKFYLGECSDFLFKDNDYVIIGAAYPKLRMKIYNELKTRGLKMFNLISPNIEINSSVQIGEANVFVEPFKPGPNVKIGSGNVLNGDVIVGHDAQIGNLNFLGGKSQVLGGVKIGDFNQIGVASIFLPQSKIGNNNKIAPMSCIYKGCKDNCYMYGNPALKIGDAD